MIARFHDPAFIEHDDPIRHADVAVDDRELVELLGVLVLGVGALLTHGRGKLPPERLKEVVEHERVERQQWLENLVDEYRSTLGDDRAKRFNPKLELLRGDPTIVIPQRVKELNADLLSIGTVSRKGLSGWLIGNTAEAILSRLDCSVVTLKPEGFVSPVSAT